MGKSCILHEDTFYEYFKPILHAGTMCDIWGGHGLETYGEDLEIVRRYDAAFVWTVVDGDSDSQWITTGFHYVNRVCYLITEKPHDSIPVEFRVGNNGRSLKPLGLKRQILKLERLMAKAKTHK
jgi:hypothetical protein